LKKVVLINQGQLKDLLDEMIENTKG